MVTQIINQSGRNPFTYSSITLLASSNANSSDLAVTIGPYDAMLVTKTSQGGNVRLHIEPTLVNDTAATVFRIGSSDDWTLLRIGFNALSSASGKDSGGVVAASQIFGLKY